jgi:hypothetical protein
LEGLTFHYVSTIGQNTWFSFRKIDNGYKRNKKRLSNFGYKGK